MNFWYDILDMNQIAERLYVSGYARAAELAQSNPHKITAVLCVHQEMDYEQNPDIIYRHIPFDDGVAIPQRAFVECLAWLKFMYENGHTILIHCAAGISRSVTILAAFMHFAEICDFREALHRIKLNRPNAEPANAVRRSAAQMLRAWPYDDPDYVSSPEHEDNTMFALTDRVQNLRAAAAHTNPDCPMKAFLLGDHKSNVPRHEIPCSCEKLLNPLEVAKEKDSKIIIPVGALDIEEV